MVQLAANRGKLTANPSNSFHLKLHIFSRTTFEIHVTIIKTSLTQVTLFRSLSDDKKGSDHESSCQ